MIATIGIGCVLFFSGDSEPTHEGKRLSEWVEILHSSDPPFGVRQPAASAIRAIGTNALPCLIRWTASEPGAVRHYLSIVGQSQRLPSWINRTITDWLIEPQMRAIKASHAFGVLGEDAGPAVPALHQIALNSSNLDAQLNAIATLALIARHHFDATKALTNIAAVTTFPEVVLSPEFFNFLGDITPFVPVLIERLKDTAGDGARTSAATLGRFTPDPERVVPALIEATASADPRLRLIAVEALGNYGDKASNALPTLQALRGDPDPGITSSISEAIYKISHRSPE
jgi:HEAT repeat protein